MNAPIGNLSAAKWMPAHDEALKKHLAAGLSHKEAAWEVNREFGTAYTRNSSIGRANRLGVKSLVAKVESARVRERLVRRPKLPPPSKPVTPSHTHAFKLPKFDHDETGRRVADVIPRHISLFELDATTCRWPYGDSNFTFCGQPVFAGCSYCEPHAALSIGPGTGQERAAHRVAA